MPKSPAQRMGMNAHKKQLRKRGLDKAVIRGEYDVGLL
jgi:hypothetical protein